MGRYRDGSRIAAHDPKGLVPRPPTVRILRFANKPRLRRKKTRVLLTISLLWCPLRALSLTAGPISGEVRRRKCNEKNWIQTLPGKAFPVMASVYIFESTWTISRIQLVSVDVRRLSQKEDLRLGGKLFRQMQLFLEVLNDVLEFREIFRRSLDQGLVSFQHRLRPSGAVFFQRYWKSLAVPFYGDRPYTEKLAGPAPSYAVIPRFAH